MESDQNQVLVSATRADGDSAEAADTSADSTNWTADRSGNNGSMEPALDSRSCTVAYQRVLRARVAKAEVPKDTENATRRERPAGLPAVRRRAAVSRSRNAPVTQGLDGRFTLRKLEAKTEASACGDETTALEGESKSKKWNECAMQPMEDTKEDSENDDDESSSTAAQMQDNAADLPESVKKKGRRGKGDKTSGDPKRRKKPAVQYVRCELEGCGVLFSCPRYLKHHVKYQHLLKKNFVCNEPRCGRMFRHQEQLLRHARRHSDQRDYICEHCSRAFKSPHNLAVHKMIHTGEKPIQCEICGYTCRQRSSLTWHMKKHDAEASYQFSCSICGKKFEKQYSVISHKAKRHPEVLKAKDVAAKGLSAISSLTPTPEKAPDPPNPQQASVSQEEKEASSDKLEPLQQTDVPQGLILTLQTQPVLQVWHLTPFPQLDLSTANQQQFIQLPVNANSPSGTAANFDNTFPTISSVTSLASPHTVQWDGKKEESDGEQGEGELWEKVVVGETHQDVGKTKWETSGELNVKEEKIEWEQEEEKPVVLQGGNLQ